MSATNKRKYANDHIYPVSTEWRISKEKVHKNEDTNAFSSPLKVENLPGVTFFLHIHFKRVDNSVENTWVYLHLTIPKDVTINVNATISCKTAEFSQNWTRKYTNNSGGYGSKICSFPELIDPEENFFVNNELVISLKAIFTVENSDPVVPKILKGESLGWQLWNNEEDKDATIVVNGAEIKVHKCVLKRRSAKFECMFKVKSEPSNKKKSGDKIIVKNHTFDTVKEAIMFCYDIQSSDTLSAEDATDIMEFASEFQINDLKKNMEEFCIENLSVTNATLFSNSSILVEAEQLHRKCFTFLLKCMKDGTAVKDIEDIDENMQKELFLQTFTKSCKD